MYTLIRSMPVSRFLSEQLPALVVSFVIAEVLYKFHSFTLECLAFLVTWFVIDGVISLATGKWRRPTTTAAPGRRE